MLEYIHLYRNVKKTKKAFILILAFGLCAIGCTLKVDKSVYDAADGLDGLTIDIPVYLPSTVVLKEEWIRINTLDKKHKEKCLSWTLQTEDSTVLVKKFYNSLFKKDKINTFFDETTYGGMFDKGLVTVYPNGEFRIKECFCKYNDHTHDESWKGALNY